jgi:eukaryotic-like serine/threonine-protein kinase
MGYDDVLPEPADAPVSSRALSGDPVDAAPDDLVGTTVGGTYRIEAFLGAGGMGAVFKATHVHMQKTVALKLLHAEMAAIPEALARFEREAVAAARITHVNIAKALDFGKLPDGSFYLVMEFVPGELLRDALASGAMAPERVVRIGAQIASALGAAHAAGIVHRDLKPENVILTSRPAGEDHVKVLDLGIARVSPAEGDTALTRAGAVLGTPQYMAPEQAMGGSVDHRADLYSLGVVLYEMAAGTPPFSDDDGAIATIGRHLTQMPPPLPTAVPETLTELILELLQKRAADRPQSAEAVVERLQLAVANHNAELLAPLVATAPNTEVEPLSSRRWRSKVVPAALVVGVTLVALTTLGMAHRRGDGVATSPSIASAARISPPAASIPARQGHDAASVAPASAPEPTTVTEARRERSAQEAKPGKGKQKKAKAKREERRTGPGGIYVPPPKDWF